MTTLLQDRPHFLPRGGDPGVPSLAARRWPNELLAGLAAPYDSRRVAQDLAHGLERLAQPLAMVYFPREASQPGEANEPWNLATGEPTSIDPADGQILRASVQEAIAKGSLDARRLGRPARWFVAAPIAGRNREPDAIGLLFPGETPETEVVFLTQATASHLVLRQALRDGIERENEASAAAALVEWLESQTAVEDDRAACQSLVHEFRPRLRAAQVAVGLRHRAKGACRLMAVSGIAGLDPRSSLTREWELALDETVIRGGATCWSSAGAPGEGSLALKKAAVGVNTRSAMGWPLRDRSGATRGALLAFFETSEIPPESRSFLDAASSPIAAALGAIERRKKGPLTRLGRALGKTLGGWRWKAIGLVLAALLAGLAWPIPHKIRCDVRVEPVTRRFVAAPFEGILEKSLARAGEYVQEGQVLARMDGREIRWKRASVEADRDQAMKKRDASRAKHDYAEMRIAALEVERLELELQLLDHRADHLEIKSPMEGVVVSGELERAEGAPLEIGQTLFEIAPLAEMVLEIAIPDEDVAHAKVGQMAVATLDSAPDTDWAGELVRVHPRAEIRDDRNVFVGEIHVDNASGRLAPGMQGRARVTVGRRAAGWVWFHKPWEFIRKSLNW